MHLGVKFLTPLPNSMAVHASGPLSRIRAHRLSPQRWIRQTDRPAQDGYRVVVGGLGWVRVGRRAARARSAQGCAPVAGGHSGPITVRFDARYGSSSARDAGSLRRAEVVITARWAAGSKVWLGTELLPTEAVARRRLHAGHVSQRPARRRRVGRDAGHNKNEVATCAPCVCARPSRSVFSLILKP